MSDEKQAIGRDSPVQNDKDENIMVGNIADSIDDLHHNGRREKAAMVDLPVDLVAERKLTTKMDIRIVPILGLLYLVSFLDRSNIANARIEGLEAGLSMPSNGFNTCLWIFYLPFTMVEIPSNLLMSLPKVKPNIFLAGQMFLLGICATCQGLTASYGGLLACRFLMGIFEAGLPAGAALLIGSYYRKKEFAVRFAWFFALAQAGSLFSGLLAFAIRDMNGIQGLAGWRWIFIIEGCITIAFSIAAYFIIPDFPETAKFITEEERTRLLTRLYVDRGDEKESIKDVNWIRVATDYKIWLLTAVFFCCDMSAASTSAFTPTILTQLGWTSKQAQVMSIPIWAVGIFAGLSSSYVSSRLNLRWPFILGGLSLAMVGWIIQLCQVQPAAVRYFALFCIASGTFVQFPLLVGWLSGNLRGRAYLAVGTALQIGLGNCANFVASNVFISSESPRYRTGFTVGLTLTALGWVLTLVTLALFLSHNKKLDAKRAADPIPDRREDDQVYYKYVL